MKLKSKSKKNYSRENGITLSILVLIIVVLLMAVGVGIYAISRKDGQKETNELENLVNNTENKNSLVLENTTSGQENQNPDPDNTTVKKVSTLVGKVVNRNTKAEDAYGNKITIPKGFKILPHGTTEGTATYTYSGDNIPAVQDGVVIENGTDGNQFVWIPVGTIINKDKTTSKVTLGRYEFDSTTGALTSTTPVQSAEDYTKEIKISNCIELTAFREGNLAQDSTAQNATARNLKEFISTTLENGGYYIARFEAGIDENNMNSQLLPAKIAEGTIKPQSKRGLKAWNYINQKNAAKLAREMYGEVKENSELVYASDLVNSYAWDTAIVFIQTCSTKEDAINYASKKEESAQFETGISNDQYCNVWNMASGVYEWTTECANYSGDKLGLICVDRGGYGLGGGNNAMSSRDLSNMVDRSPIMSFRSILYVK